MKIFMLIIYAFLLLVVYKAHNRFLSIEGMIDNKTYDQILIDHQWEISQLRKKVDALNK